MGPSTPLRLAIVAIFLLYLVPWVLLAYSLHEGLIWLESAPEGALLLRNSSPLEVEVTLSLYSGGAPVGGVQVSLPPGSQERVQLNVEALRSADRVEMTLSTMGFVEVRASWNLTGG